MNFFELLRNRGHRLMVSCAVGMMACMLILGECENRMPLAWWGFLYPEYCFMRLEQDKAGEIEENKKVKISFWLAKVFDW